MAKRRLTAEQEATNARIHAAHEATKQVVASGKCPICGDGLRRNLSLTGWWQCEQLGAKGFRKDATKPSCSWQGFTE
jgi:ribosomal protein L37AE/L43A